MYLTHQSRQNRVLVPKVLLIIGAWPWRKSKGSNDRPAITFRIPIALLTHLPPGQNERLFADDIFKCIFVNEKSCILIEISLRFVPKDKVEKQHSTGSDSGLAPNRRQAIIWTNAGPIHWRIYAALGGDE